MKCARDIGALKSTPKTAIRLKTHAVAVTTRGYSSLPIPTKEKSRDCCSPRATSHEITRMTEITALLPTNAAGRAVCCHQRAADLGERDDRDDDEGIDN